LQPDEQFALSLATALQQKGEDSVAAFLQIATKKLPQSIAIQIGLAKVYQKKGKAIDAIKITDEIIAKHPAQLDALLLKAELLETQNRSNEALQALEAAYSYAPFDVELANNLAFAYAEAKNAKALSLSDSLIRMDASGKHAEPYYFKGLYYENTGNTDKALQLFDEAVRHDYYFLDAYMEKGQVYYNQKAYPTALKSFQLAATITPTFADAYYWVAKCLEAMENKEDARLNYQRAYELDKSMSEAKQAMERLK
jgi:tetratricopeptide (TPR) repeat protein